MKEIGEICVYKLRIDYVGVDNAYCRVSQSLHCLGCVWVFYIMQWCAGFYIIMHVYRCWMLNMLWWACALDYENLLYVDEYCPDLLQLIVVWINILWGNISLRTGIWASRVGGIIPFLWELWYCEFRIGLCYIFREKWTYGVRAEFVLLILGKSRLKFLVSFDFRFLQYLFPLVFNCL